MEKVIVRKYLNEDVKEMMEIWNEVVKAGNAFPQIEELKEENAADFFKSQSYCGVAEISGKIVGLYILHPNNIGRCGHLANSSYAVKDSLKGKGIGEALVKDSLKQAKELNFRVLQFNAVVKSNIPAINLYKKLGFVELGIVPGGFYNLEGEYEDIVLYYYKL